MVLISVKGLIVGAIIRYTISSPAKTSANVELENLTDPPDFLNLHLLLPNESDKADVYQYRLESVVDEAEPELEEKVRMLCYTFEQLNIIISNWLMHLRGVGVLCFR